jgi:plastocyanin
MFSGMTMTSRRGLAAGTVAAVLALVSVAGPTGSSESAVRPAASVTISIRDNYYQAAFKRVKPRTTVTWKNNGDRRHSATRDGGGFNTGILDPGESRSVTFRKLGTYRYSCLIHPGMTGVIKVCKMRDGVRVCSR